MTKQEMPENAKGARGRSIHRTWLRGQIKIVLRELKSTRTTDAEHRASLDRLSKLEQELLK